MCKLPFWLASNKTSCQCLHILTSYFVVGTETLTSHPHIKQMNINFRSAATCWHIYWSHQHKRTASPPFPAAVVGFEFIGKTVAASAQQLPLSLCANTFETGHFLQCSRNEEESAGRGRKWISVPISSRAPDSDPRRISNTMFYKLMFLEVGQGYPPSRRQRHTSSVSPKGSDPNTVALKAVSNTVRPLSLGLHRNLYNLTAHYCVLLLSAVSLTFT